jgi:hypothetical protein
MTKRVKQNLHITVKSKVKSEKGSWDSAISDAETEIKAAQQRIATLRLSIESFKSLREKGAAFPSK